MNPHDSNPYATPQGGPSPVIKGNSKPAPPFVPASLWAMVTIGLLGIGVLIDLAQIGSSVFIISLLRRLQAHASIAPDESMASQGIATLLTMANLLALVITGVSFLTWFYRVNRNLGSLRPYGKLEYSPGWAVGGFFVPFANLIYPYQAMQEIWNHSNPSQLGQHKKRGSTLAGWWWAAWLVGNVLGNITSRMANVDPLRNLDTLLLACQLEIVRIIIHLGAAAALMTLIWRIDANQTERFELVQKDPNPPADYGPKNPWANQPSPAGVPANEAWGSRFGD